MRNYIIPLLSETTWLIIFSFSFFFGLIFISFIIINGMGQSHDLDHDQNHEFDHDINHDFDHNTDHDLDQGSGHEIINIDGMESGIPIAEGKALQLLIHTEQIDSIDTEKQNDAMVSRYIMGNITIFMMTFGATGLIFRNQLSDWTIIFGTIIGYMFAKAFSIILAKFAKSTNNPYYHIGLGDEILTVHDFDMKNKGIGNVTRRDGMTTTIITRGEYNSDIFKKGERGYIIGKLNGNIYLITKSKNRVNKLISKYIKSHQYKA